MTSELRMKAVGICLFAVAIACLIPKIAAQDPQGPPGGAPRPGQAPPLAGRAGGRPQVTVGNQGPIPEHAKFSALQIDGGSTSFVQNCAFCHGRDAAGGEAGPDLTHSNLVSSDKDGEALSPVIRNGRPDKGMPKFNLPDTDTVNLIAFIHNQQDKALSTSGNRKGVSPADLLTGNVAAGKKYFEGEGGCTKCHSETSLAGVATRNTGLRLEEQMLYPRGVKPKITVKTKSGETIIGTVDHQDEFTIAMTDTAGNYRSWPVGAISFQIQDPSEAHVTALSKYTDDDIHNLYAYIQTLK